MLQFEEQKIRLSGLDKDIKDLGDALGLAYLKKEVESLEIQASAPNFWDNIETEHEKMFLDEGIKIKALIAKLK